MRLVSVLAIVGTYLPPGFDLIAFLMVFLNSFSGIPESTISLMRAKGVRS